MKALRSLLTTLGLAVLLFVLVVTGTVYGILLQDTTQPKHADTPGHTSKVWRKSSNLPPLTAAANSSTKNPAVVKLYDLESGRFFCSGTVISRNYVLTAGHCLARYDQFKPAIDVRTLSGESVGVVAAAIFAADRSDQGMIMGDFQAFNSMEMELKTPDIIEAFEDQSRPVVACGFPYGGEYFCSAFTNRHQQLFQIGGSGFLFPGMSGGPVIDMRSGKVIGVNTAVTENGIIISPLIEILTNAGLTKL